MAYNELLTIHDITPKSGKIGPHFLLICPACDKAVKLPKTAFTEKEAISGANAHNKKEHKGEFSIRYKGEDVKRA